MQVLRFPEPNAGGPGKGPPGSKLAGLGNRFVALFAKRLSRMDFAAEVARVLQSLLRLQAVAVLGFQVRRERLVLLAAEGLGTEALAALGGGEACLWDIPLRCLRNRRISLIGGAHKNPFVPRPLAEISPRGLTVVAIPVLENEAPAGVVLLFAAGARSFPDHDLYTLSQALVVCAPVFREGEESAPQNGPVTIESAKAQETLRKLAAAGAIIDAAAVVPPPAEREESHPALGETLQTLQPAPLRSQDEVRERVREEELESLRSELEAATAKIRQLTLQNHSLQRERDELAQRVADLQNLEAGEVARLKAELDALQDRLVAAEAERTRTARLSESRVQALEQSLAALQKERETLESRGSNVEAQLAEWQTLALAVYDERDRLVSQIEALQAEVLQQREAISRSRQAHSEVVASLEADRDGWKQEALAARAKLLERNQEVARLERDWRTAVVQRDALAEQLSQAHGEIQQLTQFAEKLHEQFAEAETARAALAAELAAVRRQREEERQRWAETDASRNAELESARQAWEELASAFERLQLQYQEQIELGRAAEAKAEELRDELVRLHREQEQILAELDTARRDREEALLRFQQVEQSRADLEAQRRQLAEEAVDLRRQKLEQEAAYTALRAQYQAEKENWQEREQVLRASLEEIEQRWQQTREKFEQESLRALVLFEQKQVLEQERRVLQERLAGALADLERLGERLTASEAESRGWQERCTHLERRLQEELRRYEQLRTWAEEESAKSEEEKQALLQKLFTLEHELQQATLARDISRAEQEELAQKLAELTARYEETRAFLVAAEQARTASEAELSRLRTELADERSIAEAAQRALQAELQALRSEWERLHGQLPLLRSRLEQEEKLRLERDRELEELQRRYAEMRQQLADRGAVARQAEVLAQRVVELEQELATAKAEAARAQTQSASEWEARVVALERELAAVRGQVDAVERARAATVEELEVLRQVHQESEVLADRKLAALRDSVDRLLEERRRLEEALAATEKRLEEQRAAVLEMQHSAEEARSERDRALEGLRQLAAQLAEAQGQIDLFAASTAAAHEDAARARSERDRLAAQFEELRQEVGRAADRAANAEARLQEAVAQLQQEREVWQQALHNARAAHEHLRNELEQQRRELEQKTSAAEAATRRVLELEQAFAEAQRAAQDVQQRFEQASATWAHKEQEQTEQLRALESALRQAQEESESARQQVARWQARLEAAEQEYRSLVAGYAALEQELARRERENSAMHEEQRRLQAELQLAQASQGEQAQALAQQLQTLRTRVRALEQEKALLESALADHQKRTRDLAAAHAAAVGELQSLTENLRRQVAELNAGRVQLHQRLEEAEQQAKHWRERAEQQESELASVLERYRRLEEDLGQSERRRNEIDREIARLREELEAARREASERQGWVEQATALASRVRELEEQSSVLQGELVRSERQRATLEEERQWAEQERSELLARLAREQQRLEEQRQQLADERRRMESLLAQQQQDFEAERRCLAELRAAWERLQEEKLAGERERIELAQRLEQSEVRLQQLERELEDQRAACLQALAERDEMAEALRSAQETIADLSRGNGSARLERAVAREVRDVLPEPGPADSAGVPSSEEASTAEAIDADAPPDAPREIVLFETGHRAADASSALRAAGFEVAVHAPNEQAAEAVARNGVGYALINLGAGPQAWRTLLALRREPRCRHIKVLAYVMPPNGERGFCFGRAEFDLWPPDPARALEQLQWLRPKLRRLLAVSADVEAMGKLREPLTKANVSTSIVLDGKQALEFTSIVAPEAAVVHLGPSTSGVARAIAGLRNQESTADLPLLVLLEPTPVREEQFYAATVRELLLRSSFQFSQLPAELARLLG